MSGQGLVHVTLCHRTLYIGVHVPLGRKSHRRHRHHGGHNKNSRKRSKERESGVDGDGRESPSHTDTPAQRVQFLLGTEDGDEEHIPHALFTELDEICLREGEDAEWKETARWLKFEEDVEDGGERWSKPYVATLSLHSLFELRSCILNGTVLLDMRANSLEEIADMVLDQHEVSAAVGEDVRRRIREALLKQHHHQNHKKLANRIPIVRSFADIGKKHSEPHSMDKNVPNLQKSDCSPQSQPATTEGKEHVSRENSMWTSSKGIPTSGGGSYEFLEPARGGLVTRLVRAVLHSHGLAEVLQSNHQVPCSFCLGPLGKGPTRKPCKIGPESIATLNDRPSQGQERPGGRIDEFLDQVDCVCHLGSGDPSNQDKSRPKNVPSQEKRQGSSLPNGDREKQGTWWPWKAQSYSATEGHRTLYIGVHVPLGRKSHRRHRHHGGHNKNSRKRSKERESGVDGDGRESPSHTDTPAQRVQFLLGTEDGDEEHISHALFTELDEICLREGEDAEWKETARWLKFEEDVEDGGERWSKPYVATLSLHSLFELRSCILNGTVLLDMRANSLEEIADMVLDQHEVSGAVGEDVRRRIREALLKQHHHQNHKKLANRIPIVRSFADIGKKHSEPHSMDKNGQTVSPQSQPATTEGKEHVSRENSHVDFSKIDLHFMKKIPPGAEASNVLVGELEFLEQPVVAFVRLCPAVLLNGLAEVPITTRFLFILLGPLGKGPQYHEIGRSIATLMTDEVFHDVAYKAKDRNDLVAGIDEFLDQVTVLPPGEWDPSIRIEPPKNVPSQEKRKVPPLPNGDLGEAEEPGGHGGPELQRTGR
nr:sodium bicarbonate cotransporter 3-like [Salvelinus alpinus]